MGDFSLQYLLRNVSADGCFLVFAYLGCPNLYLTWTTQEVAPRESNFPYLMVLPEPSNSTDPWGPHRTHPHILCSGPASDEMWEGYGYK